MVASASTFRTFIDIGDRDRESSYFHQFPLFIGHEAIIEEIEIIIT